MGNKRRPATAVFVAFLGPTHTFNWVNGNNIQPFEAGLNDFTPKSKTASGLKAAVDEAAAFVKNRLAHPNGQTSPFIQC